MTEAKEHRELNLWMKSEEFYLRIIIVEDTDRGVTPVSSMYVLVIVTSVFLVPELKNCLKDIW